MGFVNQKIKGGTIALITLCYLFTNEFADARKFIDGKNNLETIKHKGTIKTIESQNGEVIDCVDIYKQPAFEHPLLKNHTIQKLPTSIRDGGEVLQGWNRNGEFCPEGSIPIVRSPKIISDYPPKVPLNVSPNRSSATSTDPQGHEYAQVTFRGTNFGASSTINVWNPSTFDQEFSLAQIWVLGGDDNSIEAGWIANNWGQKETRLFIYWTSDNYDKTGCYNLRCPGFVQVSSNVALGAELKPVSTYDGQQFQIQIIISKDQQSGDWWLQVGNEKVGYWPKSIFTKLVDSSDCIQWGGEILNEEFDAHHTSTEMGSGHFPKEGLNKASFFHFLKYLDADGTFKDANNIVPYASKPNCYNVAIGPDSSYGSYFYYGGPGFSDICRL